MRENSTEYNRVIELMAKKMGSCASEEELSELARLLSANPEYGYLAEVVASLKGNAEHVEKDVPEAELADSGWAHLAERMNEGVGSRVTRMDAELRVKAGMDAELRVKAGMGDGSRVSGMVRRMRWGWAAAVLFLLLAGTGYYRWGRQPVAGVPKSIQVGYGGKSMLVLADGTKVWLNAGSRLVYPASFPGERREVELEGEAFFDVAQQAHQPFFVHTGKITVRVLGTRFDVKAYKEDAQVSATLISGKIQVILNEDPEKKILLSPHEKLTVVNGTTNKKIVGNDTMENELRYQVQFLPQAETDWINDRMIFNNESFDEVARQMERRYAVRIEFGNEVLKREHVSGVFEKESLQQALEILKMTTKFNYKIDSNQVKLVADQN
jgi:ferric-dicitrate binding protein FerR (iron transport regulator)